MILGAFARISNVTVSFIVYPAACYDSAPARQIYVKLCIGDSYYILSRKSLLGESRQKYLAV